ncbi:MAG: 4-alpha-glucanotransferase [Promethearchaeota archaeon]
MTSPNEEKEILKNESYKGRYGGVLLHPISLPGEYGIGDLGPEIYKFIDYLHDYEQNVWQILPLGPTGYGNSPYQCFSAFAGNPMIISIEELCNIGLLLKNQCKPEEPFSEHYIDYGRVIPYKWGILELAFNNYSKNPPIKLEYDFTEFVSKNLFWLDDFSLYMSIKRVNELKPWNKWDEDLRFRDKKALERWKKDNEREIKFQQFIQFIFFKQWNNVKKYANLRNIQIIGDIPIFVAYDSADLWSNPELYFLDDKRELIYVAGVPPDYFSSSGQRWGNPLYNWDLMKKQGYKWWIQRIKHNLEKVDILRIDHFRGFESYWQIPASESTAVVGKWIPGPGLDLFSTLKEKLGFLPIIAEDLGIITPKVKNLLEQTGFPGMRVLQFAFGDKDRTSNEKSYLPHFFDKNTLVYTGTHDNQTTKSWFDNLSRQAKKVVIEYTNSDGKDIVGDLIRLAWGSVAKMAIIPVQDLLRLGDEARMNFPGKIGNNWEWRFTWDQLTPEKGEEIRFLSRLYDRN